MCKTQFYVNHASHFNDFFSSQCTLLNNNSKLPTNLNHVTDRRLSSVTFSAGGIAKIIQNINSDKAHGHDNNSIRISKICGDTINKPLELIFSRLSSQAHILLIGKRVMSFLFTKKAKTRMSKTNAQCLYYRYAAKFLKGFHLICLVFYEKIILILQNNLDLNLVTLVWTNGFL